MVGVGRGRKAPASYQPFGQRKRPQCKDRWFYKKRVTKLRLSLVKNLLHVTLQRLVCNKAEEPRFNDIPGITINIRFPGKSYSKMYGAEPQFNDLRFNDIPGLTMGILFPERKIFPGITINIRRVSPTKVIVKCMGQNPSLQRDARYRCHRGKF